MNLIAGAPSWLLLAVVVLLLAAAFQDATRLRISNFLVLAVALAAFVGAAIQGFQFALWQNVVLCVILLTVGTLLFSVGAMGGGDVKLVAATGLWFTLQDGLWFAVAMAVAGGILAIGSMVWRRAVAMGKAVATTGGGQVPYGVAIVAGALLVFAVQLGWTNGSSGAVRLPGFDGLPKSTQPTPRQDGLR